jgi:hypothetical protein
VQLEGQEYQSSDYTPSLIVTFLAP